MDGEAVSAIIGVLVQNLANVPKEDVSLIRSIKRNTEKLRETFGKTQSVLDDANEKVITDNSVKNLLKELEDVAFDADNVLDEVNYQLIAKKMKTIHTKKKKMASFFFPSFFEYLNRRQMALRIDEINTRFESINETAKSFEYLNRRQMALRIDEINTRVESINETAKSFGFIRGLTAVPLAAPETNSFTIDPPFIGREEDVSKLVEMLTTPTEEALSVLPIVGMGGLGKTALTRKVFNHEKTETHFGMRIWVHVSQYFDTLILLRKILANVEAGNVEDESRDGLLKKLQEAFEAKRYLLVLDDMWTEDMQKWEEFKYSISAITSTKGNCILVTTRNSGVGSLVKTLDMHHLNALSHEECWSIIKARALEGGDVPPEVLATGRSIAEKCQGLALAATVVGEILSRLPHDEWLSIKENGLSNIGGDENALPRMLKLSYDRLSSPSLKKCFAYCSIFPEDSQIEKNDLLQLWMAEGFLHPSQTSDMETIGNEFLEVLLQSSLLLVVDKDEYNNIKYCSMHDLVRDLAVSVLNVLNTNIHQCRYVHWQSLGEESNGIPNEQAKLLRTVFYQGKISNIMFSEFKSLHALTLSDDDAKELPDSIKELIHLRYLNISSTSIKVVPDSIGELYHLQTFKALNSSLKKLPRTFKHLLNLMHLHLLDDAELPHQLGMLTSLRTLPYFKVRDEEGHHIVELGGLKNLKGELKIDNLEKVKGEQDSKKADLVQKSGIVRLVLRWDESREGEMNDEIVLKGLQPHPNLQMLEIIGYQGRSYPSWTLNMEGLCNLKEIRVEKCEEIPSLGHLPCLKILYLSCMRNLKAVGSSFYGVSSETTNVFPELERLELTDMPSLTEWAQLEIPSGVGEETQVKVFPLLEYLNIQNCHQLRSLPSHFSFLKVLKISGLWEIVCFPDMLFLNNQNISVLEIKNCPKLRELPDGLQALNYLKELTILDCENLKSILYSSGGKSQGSTLLRRLSMGNETVIDFPCEMIEKWAPSLEVLQVWGRPIEMQMIMEFVHRMTHLRALTIDGVAKFIMTCPLELGALPQLKTFTFSPDGSGSWDCASFNRAADGILRLGSRSLETLELTGNVDWESLPEQLQHVTALSELHLYNFGIQELPQWFGNLSELRVSLCNKLKGLPSGLTNLTGLYIFRCPLLKQRCFLPCVDEENGSKISGILTIQVDGQYIRAGRNA